MSNFFKRTKMAWEENKQDEIYSKRRQYPLNEDEAYFTVEPMFDALKLRQVFDYYIHRTKANPTAQHFMDYVYRLEKDVALEKQKFQP